MHSLVGTWPLRLRLLRHLAVALRSCAVVCFVLLFVYCPVTVQRLNARQLDICRVPCCRAPHASKFYLVRLVVCSVTGMSASSAIRPTLPGAQVGTGNGQDVPVIGIVRSSIHYAANRFGRQDVCVMNCTVTGCLFS